MAKEKAKSSRRPLRREKATKKRTDRLNETTRRQNKPSKRRRKSGEHGKPKELQQFVAYDTPVSFVMEEYLNDLNASEDLLVVSGDAETKERTVTVEGKQGTYSFHEQVKRFLFDLKEKIESLSAIDFEIKELLGSLDGTDQQEEEDKSPVELDVYPARPHGRFEKLSFVAPCNVEVIGRYMLQNVHALPNFLPGSVSKAGSSHRMLPEIDLSFQIPSSIFETRDYLNYRYFNRKLLYVRALQRRLVHAGSKQVCMKHLRGDKYRPMLCLEERFTIEAREGSVGLPVKFNLIPTISLSVFPFRRFSLKQNNVRPPVNHDEEDVSGDQVLSPTPYYNHQLMEDVCPTNGGVRESDDKRTGPAPCFGHFYVLRLFYTLQQQLTSFNQTCLLIDRFLENYQLLCAEQKCLGFDSFEMKLLLAYFLTEKKLLVGNTASGFHVFVLLLSHFVSSDLSRTVLRLSPLKDARSDASGSAQQPAAVNSDSSFSEAFSLNLLSSCGNFNFFWRAGRCRLQYFHLKRFCRSFLLSLYGKTKISPTMLAADTQATNSYVENGAISYYLGNHPSRSSLQKLLSYNKCLTMEVSSVPSSLSGLASCSSKLSPEVLRRICDRGYAQYLAEVLDQTLFQGLVKTSRALSVSVGAITQVGSGSQVHLYIELNPLAQSDVLVRGPLASEKAQAQAFREFWKHKCELRRFDNSEVREAVLWTKGQQEVSVVDQMIAFVVQHHFLDKSLDVSALFNTYAVVGLDVMRVPRYCQFVRQNSVQTWKRIQKVADKFRAVLLNVTLDLNIKEVHFIHPIAYHCEAENNIEQYLASSRSLHSKGLAVKFINAVVMFESTNKWPENLNCLALLRQSFFAEIGLKLKGRVQCELQYTSKGVAFVCVFENLYFNLLLHIDREPYLLQHLSLNTVEDAKLKKSLNKLPVKSCDHYFGKVNSVNLSILSRTERWSHNARLKHVTKFATLKPSYLKAMNQLRMKLNQLTEQEVDQASRTSTAGAEPNLFAEVTRMCKFWVHSHFFSDVVSEEVLELMVTYLFTASGLNAFRVINSAELGFLRFLDLLSCHDFAQHPLIVDMNSTLLPNHSEEQHVFTTEVVGQIQEEFTVYSANHPLSCYIVTNIGAPVLESEGLRTVVVLHPAFAELISLARFSVRHYEKLTRDITVARTAEQRLELTAAVEPLFVSDLKKLSCHFIIELFPFSKVVQHKEVASKPQSAFKNLSIGKNGSRSSDLPLLNSLPGGMSSSWLEHYVDEVKGVFNSSVLVFYNQVADCFNTGCELGIRFNLEALSSEGTSAFKVAKSQHTVCTTKELSSVELNHAEIAEELYRLGSGLVKSVVIL